LSFDSTTLSEKARRGYHVSLSDMLAGSNYFLNRYIVGACEHVLPVDHTKPEKQLLIMCFEYYKTVLMNYI